MAAAIGDEMARNWHHHDGQSDDERAVREAENYRKQCLQAGSATATLVAKAAQSHLIKMLSFKQQSNASQSSQQVMPSDL